jgi:hypothetical protein
MPWAIKATPPATTVATAAQRSLIKVTSKASRARAPANCSPQDAGMLEAKAMPSSEATFQPDQFTTARPRK